MDQGNSLKGWSTHLGMHRPQIWTPPPNGLHSTPTPVKMLQNDKKNVTTKEGKKYSENIDLQKGLKEHNIFRGKNL